MSFKIEIENIKPKCDFIHVDNGNNLEVILSNVGAGIYAIRYDKQPLILEMEDKECWLDVRGYYGKTLGRVAGRIPCHGYLDNVEYTLPEKMNNYCLHAGEKNSFSYKRFKYSVKEFKNKVQVSFKFRSKENDCGFPGAVNLKVIYEIFDNNNFKITYKGNTNQDTLMNISNHAYFNLGGEKDISDYKLKVNASTYGVVDETTFIVGHEEVPPYLDFRKMTKLQKRLDYVEIHTPQRTIDHTFVFDQVNKSKPQVILQNDKLNLKLYTDYPCLNIYVDCSGRDYKFNNFEETTSLRRAIAIEPQLFNFDRESIILRKDQKYSHFIMYKFKKVD